MPSTRVGTEPSRANDGSSADALRATLEALGVSFLFGMDAPAALQATLGRGTVRPITVRDERSAAFMADGYAKVSGRPGVLGIGGVGATNAVQGIVESYLGSTPVVLLVEEGSAVTRHRHELQDLDRARLFAPITKWAGEIERPERAGDLAAHAFRLATSGRPGPVYLGCPWDVVSLEAGPSVPADAAVATYPADRVAPDAASLRRAVDALTSGDRTAIVAGGGVLASGATAELAALAHRLGAPVATTPAGKGAFDEFDPRSAGVVGSYAGGAGGRGRAANEVILAADAVLLVGTSTGSGATAGWTVPDPTQTIVHLDIDPAEIGRNYPGTLPLVADARLGLEALVAAMDGPDRHLWAELPAPLPAGVVVAGDRIHPALIYDELQASLDDRTIVVADAGYCAAWGLDRLRFRAPGRRFLSPSAYGTLGYGLPAALGAAIAAPEETVVCLTGDGGFAYALAELETAARYGLAVTTIVLNNGGLAWSRHYDRHFYGYEGETSFADVDHAAVARALGCEGIRVTEFDDLPPALATALRSSTPTVIDVLTDPDARPPVDMFD